MEYRYLGASGLQVSALSLGAWVTYGEQVDEQQGRVQCHAAHASAADPPARRGGPQSARPAGNAPRRPRSPR